MKLPIVPETHEKALIFDIKRHPCCEDISELDLLYQTQATQAMAAGHFGYSARMQDIGLMELKKMQESYGEITCQADDTWHKTTRMT